MLNDEFDPELRRITLSDSDKADFGTVVYRRAARRPLKLPLRAASAGEKIYRREFTGAGAVDFIGVSTKAAFPAWSIPTGWPRCDMPFCMGIEKNL